MLFYQKVFRTFSKPIFVGVLGVFLNAAAYALEPAPTYSNPEKYRVSETHLDLTIDFNRKILHGSATLKAERIEEDAELWLDSNHLNIQGVSWVDPASSTATRLEWRIQSSKESDKKRIGQRLIVSIPEWLRKRENFLVKIAYETSPKADGLVWMDSVQTRTGHPFMFSMHEPTGARSVFPCQDTPAVRGHYYADLKIDATGYGPGRNPLMALVSGENNPRVPNENMTYKGLKSTKAPIPSYLFVLAAGRFLHYSVNEKIGYYAHKQEILDQAKIGLKEFVPRYYEELTKLFGEDPWGRHDFLFLPGLFAFGGMENPQLIYINGGLIEKTGSAAYVMAHELAHQWTGNIVTNKSWKDFWLNEGFTSYAEYRVLEIVHGKAFSKGILYERFKEVTSFHDLYLQNQNHLGTEKFDVMTAQLTQLGKNPEVIQSFHPDGALDFSVYGKGAFFLRMIEKEIGKPNMDKFLREYIQEFAFKGVTSEDFVQFATSKLAQYRSDLNWSGFLFSWIYTPGLHPEPIAGFKAPVLPTCPDCEKRVREFKAQGAHTSFEEWTPSQIDFLLSHLREGMKTAQTEGQEVKSHLEAIEILQNSESFRARALPLVGSRSLWYQVLVDAGIWKTELAGIQDLLTEFGRSRVINSLYRAFFAAAKTDQEAHGFATQVFSEMEGVYFPFVSEGIRKMGIQHDVLTERASQEVDVR